MVHGSSLILLKLQYYVCFVKLFICIKWTKTDFCNCCCLGLCKHFVLFCKGLWDTPHPLCYIPVSSKHRVATITSLTRGLMFVCLPPAQQTNRSKAQVKVCFRSKLCFHILYSLQNQSNTWTKLVLVYAASGGNISVSYRSNLL